MHPGHRFRSGMASWGKNVFHVPTELLITADGGGSRMQPGVQNLGYAAGVADTTSLTAQDRSKSDHRDLTFARVLYRLGDHEGCAGDHRCRKANQIDRLSCPVKRRRDEEAKTPIGFPKWNVQVQKALKPVAHVNLDWHTVNVCSLRAMLQAHLQGNLGDWSQDQFDEFRCARCGMEAAAVIENSGYRITRLVEIDAANVLWLTVRKFSPPCTVAGRTSQDGPTGLLQERMRVPPGDVAVSFQFP